MKIVKIGYSPLFCRLNLWYKWRNVTVRINASWHNFLQSSLFERKTQLIDRNPRLCAVCLKCIRVPQTVAFLIHVPTFDAPCIFSGLKIYLNKF